jgi:hypothetical protein
LGQIAKFYPQLRTRKGHYAFQWTEITTSRAAAGKQDGGMYKAYFSRRLLEALSLADQALDEQERSIHLRASRYYCALLGLQRVPTHHSNGSHSVAEKQPGS